MRISSLTSRSFKVGILICAVFIQLIGSELKAQEFLFPPSKVLKTWDYYSLKEKIGDGIPIVDTMLGQAYIAGMSYPQEWLGRKVTASYYFNDVDIERFAFRCWSPWLIQREDGKPIHIPDPELRKALEKEFQQLDAVAQDSINRVLNLDPPAKKEFMAIINDSVNVQARFNAFLDEKRCDSMVKELSQLLGPPTQASQTHHTEKNSRYSAMWINQGIAVSLKDFIDYTDVVFTVPLINQDYARAYNVSPDLEVLKKQVLAGRKNETFVSLLGLPVSFGSQAFSEVCLLTEVNKEGFFLDKVFHEDTLLKPEISFVNLDLTGPDEIILQGVSSSNESFLLVQIFTMANEEPIILFNSELDTKNDVEVILKHGFQAEVILSDGSGFMFPVPKEHPEIKAAYNSNGVLTKEPVLTPKGLTNIEIEHRKKGEKPLLLGTIPVTIGDKGTLFGHLRIRWELSSGYWDVKDYEFSE